MAQWIALVATADRAFGEHAVRILDADPAFEPALVPDGSAAIAALRSSPSNTPTIVVVDSALTDMSPLNLIGAITSSFPGAGVVFVAPVLDESVTGKAMLAGARAVMARAAIESDLLLSAKRVGASILASAQNPGRATRSDDQKALGKSLLVVGAKGGAGRTTVSSLLAFQCALMGYDVGLLDFDLQFGDLSFVFDVQPQRTLIDIVRDLQSGLAAMRPYGTELYPGLTFYAPSPQPEQAELVAPKAGLLLRALCMEHEIVVINTGAFWTLLHAELIDAADQSIFVLNPSAVAVRATLRARSLCTRLGVPDAQLCFVLNRASQKSLISKAEVVQAIRSHAVYSLADGGEKVSEAADAGRMDRVLQTKGPFSASVSAFATELLARVDAPAPRTEPR